MADFTPESPTLISRLLRDPVRLRRRSRVLALVVAAAAGVAGSGWLDFVPGNVVTAITWLFVPVVAAGIGVGDAFFLRHGIGGRRIALTLIAGVLAATLGCAILAFISTSESEVAAIRGLLYGLLVLGVIATLASFIAMVAGRGEKYLSRKLQDVDDTGW